MKVELQKEHHWLEQLVGEWTWEMETPMEPGGPPQKFTGTETVRSIGGGWIVGEGEGQMPDGSPTVTILTLGFDPAKNRFVGTWIGTMMSHLWVYSGQLDAAEKVLSLDTEGPAFDDNGKMTDKMTNYKDVITLKSEDHRTLTGNMLTKDGSWFEMMTMHYYRK